MSSGTITAYCPIRAVANVLKHHATPDAAFRFTFESYRLTVTGPGKPWECTDGLFRVVNDYPTLATILGQMGDVTPKLLGYLADVVKNGWHPIPDELHADFRRAAGREVTQDDVMYWLS